MPTSADRRAIEGEAPMPKSIDQLRRDAKALRRAYEAGSPVAIARMTAQAPRSDGAPFRHADFLHVIARENR